MDDDQDSLFDVDEPEEPEEEGGLAPHDKADDHAQPADEFDDEEFADSFPTVHSDAALDDEHEEGPAPFEQQHTHLSPGDHVLVSACALHSVPQKRS